jgi:hypothetical protein
MGLHVAWVESTGPRVAREEARSVASMGPHVVQVGSTRPREAQEEARTEVLEPRVARAMVQGEAPGVEGEPDRIQGGSRDQWVGRSQ